MKHIEQIQPEVAAGDLSRLLVSEPDATATAALTALLHNVTGCDIPQTDTTPQSEVEELVPLCLSILRRHWTTPLTALGDGTTPMSLADLMRRLIGDRVQGNEAWCIPPVHDNIPAAVSALRERKIGGVPQAPDGISLAQLLCGVTDKVTEIVDSNKGWDLTRALNTLWTILPNLSHSRLALNFKTAPVGVSFTLGADAEELVFDDIETFGATSGYPGETYDIAHSNSRVKKISIAKLRMWERGVNGGIGSLCPNLEEIYAPSLSYINYNYWHYSRNENSFYGAISLRKTIFGAPNQIFKVLDHGEDGYNCLNWIHLEFSGEVGISMNLIGWSPTNALDASRTDLVEDPTASNNLEQFLSNFRLYIADRLSDNGSGKTLTLSQEVRDAIHSAGIDTIITNKGWTISPVPTQQ